MKKLACLIVAAVAASSVAVMASVWRHSSTIFTQNVEALTGTEHAIGGCDSSTTVEYTGVCDDCGLLVYAPGYFGIGYNIHH